MKLYGLRVILLIIYGILVTVALAKWAPLYKRYTLTTRQKLGSAGLILGSCSAVLFLWFYIHFWIFDTLVTHGSALWIYTLTGWSLAVAGVLLGTAGCGWVRASALLVSVIVALQWFRDYQASVAAKNIVDTVMLAALALLGITVFGVKLRSQSLIPKSPK